MKNKRLPGGIVGFQLSHMVLGHMLLDQTAQAMHGLLSEDLIGAMFHTHSKVCWYNGRSTPLTGVLCDKLLLTMRLVNLFLQQ